MHCGEAITGEIGFRDHITFTAMGDAPNVASRLQQMTKELGCEALISDPVFIRAGLSGDPLPVETLSLRGRANMIPARVLHHVEAELAALLDRGDGRARAASEPPPAMSTGRTPGPAMT